MSQLYFRAPVIAHNTNGGLARVIPSQLFPTRKGPNGKRLVVECIKIESSLFYTTGAGVTMAGADFSSSIKELRIHDGRRYRRKFSGFYTRMKSFLDLGTRSAVDPSSLAASQTNVNKVFVHWVQFAQPKSRRQWDYAMPVDHLLDGGGLEWDMPAPSDLLATGGSPTFGGTQGNYTVTAYCREEGDVEFHSIDQVEVIPQSQNQSWTAKIAGRKIRELVIAKAAASGGTVVTTVTDVTLAALFMTRVPRASFKDYYLAQAAYRTSDDPVFNDFALPILFPRWDSKQKDYQRFADDMLLEATSTLATPDILLHTVVPRDKSQTDAEAKANGVSPKGSRMKTAGKSSRSPADHDADAAFLPAKQDAAED